MEPAWLRPAGAEPAQARTEKFTAEVPQGDSPPRSAPAPLYERIQLPETDSEPGPVWLRHAGPQATAVGSVSGATAGGLPAHSPVGSGPTDALDLSGLALLLARLDEFQGPDGVPGTSRRGLAPSAAEGWGDPAPGPAPEHSAAPAGAFTSPEGASVSSSKLTAEASAGARAAPSAHGMAAPRGGSSGSAAAKAPAPRPASGAADLRERLELETLAHGQCAHLTPIMHASGKPSCFPNHRCYSLLCSHALQLCSQQCYIKGHRMSPWLCTACQELQEHLL